MILIVFPDETTMLYDCNVRQDDKDWILSYLEKHIPYRYDSSKREESQWIDIFVNSHRDLDHYRGLSEINNRFEIRAIWDSGRAGENTQDDDYKYYMRLRLSLADKYGEEALIVPIPSDKPMRCYGNAEIYCLCSAEEYTNKFYASEKVKVQHTDAIVLSIKYAGRTLLLTSDSDWKAWKEKIVPSFGKSGILKSNILLASHHGSRSFFTDEEQNEHIDIEENPETTYLDHIKDISPNIVLISCGEYDQFHHPNTEALDIYKNHTSYSQVYTSKDKGTFVGFIDQEGNWTVSPSRFSPEGNKSFSFDIQCKENNNGVIYQKKSGDNFQIRTKLSFSIVSRGGLLDPFNAVDVLWEVSNGGINSYHSHQEIYYKGEKEGEGKLKFSREVAYEGRHLLRCKVKNRMKNIDVTRIFVVNGAK